MRRRRPLLPRLHRWIGVGLAAWLVLVALSGGLLLFSDAWLRWRLAVADTGPVPAWPEAETLVRLLEGAGGPVAWVGLARPGAPWAHVERVDGTACLLHPADGSLLASHTPTSSLVSFLYDLHAMLLAGDVGQRVVGVLGIVLLGTLLAGLLLWLRRRRAFDLRSVAVSEVTPQAVLRSHVAQGVLASGLLFAIALSGVTFVFPEAAGAVLDAALGRTGPTRPIVHARTVPPGPTDWTAVLATGRAAFPEGRLRFVTLPAAADGVVVLRLRTPEELHPHGGSYVVVEPTTGALLQRIDARERGLGPAVLDALYPLHAGSTGWPGHRWVLLLGAFLLLRLVTTSLWLQTDRRARRRRLAALAQAGAAAGGSGRSTSARRPASQPIGR
ncbi:MAG: PepSY-associated TM helix domain-containing protein [Pseudomonadales bacterium]|jgi:uncharacterized iron-regulated membrane protein|nr:PepSY-associated TM helix domain-containing protein [Pseudomonadales bacterium]